MRVELDTDEAWELMSRVVTRLLDEAELPKADKAQIRRWRSNEMRPGSDAMRVLAEKMNADIQASFERKKRSAIRKPDWR